MFLYAVRGQGDVAAILGYREDERQRAIHLASAHASLYVVTLYCVIALVVVRARGGKGWEYIGVTSVLSLSYFIALAVSAACAERAAAQAQAVNVSAPGPVPATFA